MKQTKKTVIGRRKKKVSNIKKMKKLYAEFKEKGEGEHNGKVYRFSHQKVEEYWFN